MLNRPYLSGQMLDVLHSLQSSKFSGIVYVKAQLGFSSQMRDRVLTMHEGNLVYGGLNLPTPLTFARRLGKIFKPSLIDVALQVAEQKMANSDSFYEILSLLVKMRVLTWEQLHLFVFSQLVWTLEQLQPYPGQIRLAEKTNFDMRGIENNLEIAWDKLTDAVVKRQQEWRELAPFIPSMEAIPYLPSDSLNRINDKKVAEHLQKWVNGERSLIDISYQMLGQDPLKMARSYFRWTQMEWVAFRDPSAPETPSGSLIVSEKATILAVDDSPIVQTMIRRALSDRYNVLLASNAMEALNLLKSKSIQLLLLDVTMPDIDGLEVCSTVRSIPKFRNLPIIMLTARDGHVDKFKGYMAGSTKYLTKPFQNEELLAVIAEYVSLQPSAVSSQESRVRS